MKKISIVSILSVLVAPAIAETTGVHLYGNPENIKQADAVQSAIPQAAEQQQITNVKEIEQVEVKKVKEQYANQNKQIEKNNEVKETEKPKPEEQKYNVQKTTSNPKTRFPHGLQLGLGVSPTSGLNAFIGYNNKNFDSFWWKRFGVRFDFATYSPIKNKLNKGINNVVGDDGIKVGDYLKIDDFALDAKHYGVLVDFYPFGDTWFLGGLRISGGYMSGKLGFDAAVHGTKTLDGFEFELDGKKYVYEGGEMNGKAMLDWKYRGPYLGGGFDLGIFRGFKLYFDAGVVFTDESARLDLYVPTDGLKDVAANAPVKGNAALESAYEQAKNATLKDAQKELDDYQYYPIVKLGFMYRF